MWTPTGRLSAGDQAKVDLLPNIHFAYFSTDTMIVSSLATAPSYVTGGALSTQASSEIAVADALTGALVNNSDRTLVMAGTVTYQLAAGGGGASQFNLWSERSTDNGATWTPTVDSLRDSEISNNTASSQTKTSLIGDWQPGEWLRFAFYKSGGALSLEAPTDTVNAGQAVNGFSFAWELRER